jgi:hypothetical protein
MAIYYTSRQYYVEHLVLALYFVSFFLSVLTAIAVLGLVSTKVLSFVSPSENVRHIISRGFEFWIPLGALAIYLFFAFRTFYRSSISRALIGIPFVLAVSIAAQNFLSWLAVLLIIISI